MAEEKGKMERIKKKKEIKGTEKRVKKKKKKVNRNVNRHKEKPQ